MSAWKTPPVAVGDMVDWFPDKAASSAPLAAVVTAVTGFSVCLSIIHTNLLNFTVRDGVKHKNDPSLREIEANEEGCWAHRPLSPHLEELILARVTELCSNPSKK